MQLIVGPPRKVHVSYDTVLELESVIVADPRVTPAEMNGMLKSAVDAGTRALARAGIDAGSFLGVRRRSLTSDQPARDYFAVMIGLDPARAAPWFVLPSRRSVYMFDAWPSSHVAIRKYVESWGVQYAFVSSSQAATRLASISDSCTFVWVPEGIDPRLYHQRSWIEKDIDVLQLGRRYDSHHELIAPALAKAGKTYLYEKRKGEIIFPAREEFTEGLARSRISICFPSSVTHPQRAGDIETMTIRYLQSMVSKCVVLGRAPAEMVELFGYDPVVPADMGDPAGQIMEILERYEEYLPLVERNYSTVIRDHTWSRRWERMATVLFKAPGQSSA
ncbi:MAG: glycosyltransferase [Gemmatimonadales bacterium]